MDYKDVYLKYLQFCMLHTAYFTTFNRSAYLFHKDLERRILATATEANVDFQDVEKRLHRNLVSYSIHNSAIHYSYIRNSNRIVLTLIFDYLDNH